MIRIFVLRFFSPCLPLSVSLSLSLPRRYWSHHWEHTRNATTCFRLVFVSRLALNYILPLVTQCRNAQESLSSRNCLQEQVYVYYSRMHIYRLSFLMFPSHTHTHTCSKLFNNGTVNFACPSVRTNPGQTWNFRTFRGVNDVANGKKWASKLHRLNECRRAQARAQQESIIFRCCFRRSENFEEFRPLSIHSKSHRIGYRPRVESVRQACLQKPEKPLVQVIFIRA